MKLSDHIGLRLPAFSLNMTFLASNSGPCKKERSQQS